MKNRCCAVEALQNATSSNLGVDQIEKMVRCEVCLGESEQSYQQVRREHPERQFRGVNSLVMANSKR